jgi:hypothetical protein
MWIALSLKCPLDRVYNKNYTQSIVERERKEEGRDERKVGGRRRKGRKERGKNGKGRDGSRERGNEEGREERKEKGER